MGQNHDVYLSDNIGNRVPPGCVSGAPVAATGQTLTATTAGTDYTATVKAGKTYQVIATVGNLLMGIASVATAANIIWFVPLDHARVFTMPAGYTTLYFTGSANSTVAYLVEMDA
jgi:hypothetical protein